MKTMTSLKSKFARVKPAMLIAAALVMSVTAPGWAGNNDRQSCDKPKVASPNERYQGKTYNQWSAAWWQWNMELPLAGHPSIDSPDFDVRAGQRGNVWFLAAPFGTVERTCTIPKNKSLFIGLLDAEASDLEGLGTTVVEQSVAAMDLANHIVVSTLFCTIDGVSVNHLNRYRKLSRQFEFTAPTPWIFGGTGGEGTAVGDGYYVLIEPLSKGQHTIHYGGLIRFTLAEDGFDLDLPLDMIYHLKVK